MIAKVTPGKMRSNICIHSVAPGVLEARNIGRCHTIKDLNTMRRTKASCFPALYVHLASSLMNMYPSKWKVNNGNAGSNVLATFPGQMKTRIFSSVGKFV